MSGGSFNYLYRKEDIVPELGTLKEMYQVLKDVGIGSQATFDMVQMIVHFEMAINKFNKLRNVFQAVEWYVSCDYGLDQVELELDKYDKEKKG